MQVSQGDRVVIRGRTVDAPERHGTVLEVRGAEGEGPYLVKFDDGHEGLVFPGGDFEIEHSNTSAPPE